MAKHGPLPLPSGSDAEVAVDRHDRWGVTSETYGRALEKPIQYDPTGTCECEADGAGLAPERCLENTTLGLARPPANHNAEPPKGQRRWTPIEGPPGPELYMSIGGNPSTKYDASPLTLPPSAVRGLSQGRGLQDATPAPIFPTKSLPQVSQENRVLTGRPGSKVGLNREVEVGKVKVSSRISNATLGFLERKSDASENNEKCIFRARKKLNVAGQKPTHS